MIRFEDLVIKQDLYDLETFEKIKEKSSELKELHEKTDLPGLLNDIYASLYKIKPILKKETPIHLQTQKTIIENMLKTNQYKELHERTKLDEVGSAIATVTLAREILKNEEVKIGIRKDEVAREIKRLEDEITVIENLLKNVGIEGERRRQFEERKKQVEGKLKEIKEEFKKLSDPDPQKIRIAIRKAMKQAENELDRVDAFIPSWGTEAGQPQMIPMEEKAKLAQAIINDPKLKEIAELAGRMKNIAISKQKSRIKHAQDEVVDITTGSDLNKILPSELVTIKHPKLKLLFYKKLIENSLMEYDLKSRETEGRGPVICCIDTSGSMKGLKEIWSKAVALSLLTIAYRQKRHFAIVIFSNRDQVSYEIIDPRRDPPTKIIQALKLFFSGGTDFEEPLTVAVELMGDLPKADIVFLTDGECDISDEFLAQYNKIKRKLDFRCIGVQFNPHYQSDVLEKFCDIVYVYKPDSEREILEEVFSL